MSAKTEILTAFRDLCSEVNFNFVFGAQIGVVSQRRAQAAASTTTGLVATLLLVDVWTDVAMARSEHTPQKHITLGCIEHCTHAKLLMGFDLKLF